MPRELDNSTGGQLVVHDERFGPLDGKLMHVSFGKGWIYYHMQEQVEGVTQGAVVANYTVERWNYRWASSYGSDHWSLDNPGATGNDSVPVRTAVVAEDGRSVLLMIDDIRPVDQMMIRIDIAASNGTPYKEVTYLTVHRVPGSQDIPER